MSVRPCFVIVFMKRGMIVNIMSNEIQQIILLIFVALCFIHHCPYLEFKRSWYDEEKPVGL